MRMTSNEVVVVVERADDCMVVEVVVVMVMVMVMGMMMLMLNWIGWPP